MDERTINFSRDAAYADLNAHKFNYFLQEKDFVDFEIKVRNESIKCHKIIMATHSPVLCRMMKSEMKEGKENCVTLNDLCAPALMRIMEYIYTGCFSCPFSLLLDVVRTCDFLEITHLAHLCWKKVPKLLNHANAIGWFRLASLLDIPRVSKKCKKIICSEFTRVSEGDEFLSLAPSEVKECMMEWTKNRVLTDDLLSGLLRWFKFDLCERKNHGEELMALLELHNCSQALLRSALPDIRDVVDTECTIYQHYLKCMTENLKVEQDRHPELASLLLVGGHENSKGWKITEEREFVEVLSIPDDDLGMNNSICLYEDIGVVVTGGEEHKDTCTLFHFQRKEWTKKRNMPTARCYHSSICVDDVLFVFGGLLPRGDWSKSVAMLSLDEADDEDWREGPELPRVVEFFQVTKLESDVFVVGSRGEMLHLDVDCLTWSQKANCPLEEQIGETFNVAAGDGKVYVAGGWEWVCCIYTPFTDTWIIGHSPRLEHPNGGLVWINHSLLLVGGRNQEEIEKYKCEEDCWETLSIMAPVKNEYICAFHVYLED